MVNTQPSLVEELRLTAYHTDSPPQVPDSLSQRLIEVKAVWIGGSPIYPVRVVPPAPLNPVLGIGPNLLCRLTAFGPVLGVFIVSLQCLAVLGSDSGSSRFGCQVSAGVTLQILLEGQLMRPPKVVTRDLLESLPALQTGNISWVREGLGQALTHGSSIL